MADNPRSSPTHAEPLDSRRQFVTKTAAIACGAAVAVAPLAAGSGPLLDPLWRTSEGGDHGRWISITAIDGVPDDGIPRRFPVVADRSDSWNYFPKEPIGSVYLMRDKGSNAVRALNAECPHLGCTVSYVAEKQLFQCPCHTSAFDVQGVRRLDLSQVPPRNMDKLTCELRDGQVWVRFQKFYTGREEQVAKT